ncbi:MAG: aldo/keto reductase [Candidatus Bathyarchaeota archaeon]|nr:aldo/keto reductase [Candidatus Bathyarchaeota archaeon]
MEKRKLGRTNLNVSVIGFGAMWLPGLKTEEAASLVQHAYELGINYFDTARNYGDSEEKLGLALQNIKDGRVIATKIGSRTKKESSKHIKESLQKLKTDKIDILQLHGIDDETTLKKAIGTDGVLQTCKKAKKEGLIDFIGISSHRPNILVKAIATGEFDAVLVPLNIMTPQATEELLPVAKKQDVGVVIMKPFAFKVANMMTWRYKPSLSFFSEEPELRAFLGEDNHSKVRNALGFIISQDISTIIPGFKSVQEVELAIKAEEELSKPEPREKTFPFVELEEKYCRDCGLCLPCPQKLNIPAMLRFYDLYRMYKLKSWAQKLYSGLNVKAEICDSCGDCESKCPYEIPIHIKLKEISEIFH